MVLEAKHISFRYGKESRQILEDFHLKMTQEERVGLIAPSGFGKTTFCKILAGYERPDDGEVLLDGRPLSSFGRYCPVQMIWQHPEQAVNPRLKMREVLAEGDGIEPRVIEGLGIEPDWLNRYPGEISGGEMQRFCIARALGERTRFLLADEISTMLDAITQAQLWKVILEEARRREMGILAITHNQHLARRIAEKTIDLSA